MRPALVVLFAVAALGPAGAFETPRPVLASGADGRAVVAWVEPRGPVTVGRVARWTDGRWDELGGPLNRDPAQAVSSVALAVAPDGAPWAAWGERPLGIAGKDRGAGRLHVARWSGGSWDEQGPSPSRSPRTIADLPQLRIDGGGQVWLLWSELTPDLNVENVYLARRLPDGWGLVDDGSLTTDISSAGRSRDLRLGPGGTPWLAWSKLALRQNFQVFAGPWDGRWAAGAPQNADPEAYAGAPSLAFAADGGPWLAFTEAGPEGFRLQLRRLGPAPASPPPPRSAGIRSPGLVALGSSGVTVGGLEAGRGLVLRRWAPEGWSEVGPALGTPGAFVDSWSWTPGPGDGVWLVWAEDDAAGVRLSGGLWAPDGGWTPMPARPLPPAP